MYFFPLCGSLSLDTRGIPAFPGPNLRFPTVAYNSSQPTYTVPSSISCASLS